MLDGSNPAKTFAGETSAENKQEQEMELTQTS